MHDGVSQQIARGQVRHGADGTSVGPKQPRREVAFATQLIESRQVRPNVVEPVGVGRLFVAHPRAGILDGFWETNKRETKKATKTGDSSLLTMLVHVQRLVINAVHVADHVHQLHHKWVRGGVQHGFKDRREDVVKQFCKRELFARCAAQHTVRARYLNNPSVAGQVEELVAIQPLGQH